MALYKCCYYYYYYNCGVRVKYFAVRSRPDTSFLWFMNPLKTLKYIIWKNYKWLILKLFIVLLILCFIGLLIYTMPEAMTHRIFNP